MRDDAPVQGSVSDTHSLPVLAAVMKTKGVGILTYQADRDNPRPSGPIEAAKESMATVKSATNPSSREQLVTEVALDIQAEVQQKRNPLKGYRPSLEGTAPSGEQVLVELSAVQAIVAAQATPEETAAFGQWLVASAQAAATPPRRAVSWGSAPRRSARARGRCWTRCARRSHSLSRARSQVDPLEAHIGN